MSDKVAKKGKSLIQYGKENNRVYIMKSRSDEIRMIADEAIEICRKEGFTKVFAKVTGECAVLLREMGFHDEAVIPDFGIHNQSLHFMGLFLSVKRSLIKDKDKIDEIKSLCLSKKSLQNEPQLSSGYRIRMLEKADSGAMAKVFSKVFDSYPFPVFDPSFIEETMNNTYYGGIWKENELVSIASTEYDPQHNIAEMTDFATLPEFRGNHFAEYQLDYLEKKLEERNCSLYFTIARAVSPGMNISFKKRGYQFAGTLCNNTQIAGKIESMNIWYKKAGYDGHIIP